MPTLHEELALDLAAGISAHEQTFIWSGRPIACVRNPAPAGLGFEDGGEVHEIAELILVARSEFPGPLPAVGDGIDNDQAQIKKIDPNATSLILHIGSFDSP